MRTGQRPPCVTILSAAEKAAFATAFLIARFTKVFCVGISLITENVHGPLQSAFLNFAGVADGRPGIYADFLKGVTQYRLWVLKSTK